jgi:hypothetical protein
MTAQIERGIGYATRTPAMSTGLPRFTFWTAKDNAKMEKLNYAAERKSALSSIEKICGSSESPEKKYIELLQTAFDSAHRICNSASSGRPLDLRDLLTFSFARPAMYKLEVASLNFDGWPETSGIIFNIFARQSAMELAGAFVAAVVGRLYATEPLDFLRKLEKQDEIEMSAMTDWLERAFSNLRDRLDLSNPTYFDRDSQLLALQLDAESERFFNEKTSTEKPNATATTEPETTATDWGRSDHKATVCRWIRARYLKNGKTNKAEVIRAALAYFGLPADYERRVRTEYDKRHKK